MKAILTLGCLLMLGSVSFGQTANVASSVVDGSQHPEQIPDLAAYRLYLKAVADSGHIDDYLVGLPSGAAAKAIILDHKTKFDALVAWYNNLPETQAGSNARTAEFLADRDLLVSNTKTALAGALSTAEMSALDAHVISEKRNMKYAPETATGTTAAAFHHHLLNGGGQSGCNMIPNYSVYTTYAASSISIPIQNPSFETYNTLNQYGYNTGPVPGWWYTNNGGNGGSWSVSQPYLTPADGSIVAYSGGGWFWQETSTAFAPNTTYMLMVFVGGRSDYPQGQSYTVGITNQSGSWLSTTSGSTATTGTMAAVQVTYTTNGTPPSGNIGLVLLANNGSQVQFDAVSLVTTNTASVSSTATISGYTNWNCSQYSNPLHTGYVANNFSGDSNPAVYGPAITLTSYTDVFNSDSVTLTPGQLVSDTVTGEILCNSVGQFFVASNLFNFELAQTTLKNTQTGPIGQPSGPLSSECGDMVNFDSLWMKKFAPLFDGTSGHGTGCHYAIQNYCDASHTPPDASYSPYNGNPSAIEFIDNFLRGQAVNPWYPTVAAQGNYFTILTPLFRAGSSGQWHSLAIGEGNLRVTAVLNSDTPSQACTYTPNGQYSDPGLLAGPQ
jgi:hypothetical protein